jgi:hypothetical protein
MRFRVAAQRCKLSGFRKNPHFAVKVMREQAD